MMTMTEGSPKTESTTCSSGNNNINNDSNTDPAPSAGGLLFRPSKLTPLADKMFENCKSKVEELHKTPSTTIAPSVLPASFVKSDSRSESTKLNPAVANGDSSHTQKPPPFVFGRNIDERVTGKPDEKEERVESKTDESSKEEEATGSSTSGSIAQSQPPQTTTGEEGESNVIQMTCKLHAYDKKSGEFRERGRGILRLNKVPRMDNFDYRIVMRSEGRLRVILNSKLWPSMLVESASSKKIKISATDPENDGQITVFVISASESDCQSLQLAINEALEKIRKRSAETSAPIAPKRKLDSSAEDSKEEPSPTKSKKETSQKDD